MALTLDPDERDHLLRTETTGILTTLRRDGSPVALPIWFVLHDDGELYVRTPRPTAKLTRIRRDPRGSFLVETGQRWTELAAVHLDVRISEVTDEATAATVHAALDARYADLAVATERLPRGAQALYADRVVLKLTPVKELSWSNAKIRLKD